MAILRPKPWIKPFGKMSIFRLFVVLFFTAQKGVFLFQNIVRDIFLCYIAEKEKVGKRPIVGRKPWVNPFGKMSILRFFDLVVFFGIERRFFVLEYRKRHFPGFYCLQQKDGKTVIFGQKPWVNPFGKMSIFRLFQLLVFLAQKGVFSFQNIVKDIFLAYLG